MSKTHHKFQDIDPDYGYPRTIKSGVSRKLQDSRLRTHESLESNQKSMVISKDNNLFAKIDKNQTMRQKFLKIASKEVLDQANDRYDQVKNLMLESQSRLPSLKMPKQFVYNNDGAIQ